jgi:hypothetical protein
MSGDYGYDHLWEDWGVYKDPEDFKEALARYADAATWSRRFAALVRAAGSEDRAIDLATNTHEDPEYADDPGNPDVIIEARELFMAEVLDMLITESVVAYEQGQPGHGQRRWYGVECACGWPNTGSVAGIVDVLVALWESKFCPQWAKNQYLVPYDFEKAKLAGVSAAILRQRAPRMMRLI